MFDLIKNTLCIVFGIVFGLGYLAIAIILFLAPFVIIIAAYKIVFS